MKRPKNTPQRKQPTSQELLDGILAFIQSKFYAGDPVAFSKDRRRLLSWVVLRFAAWLDERGVTISSDRYREILVDKILMVAVRMGNTGTIQYRPAWLGKVVETHLAHHGDEYYEEAKSMRNLVENAILVAGQSRIAAPDPVRDLAQLSRLVRPKKPSPKAPVKAQLTLL